MTILLLTLILILAVASLTMKKSVSAIISFAIMMLLLGIYYISLHEKMLGLFQIFVYTGGIVVLMLFGVTIIGKEFPKAKNRAWASLFAFISFVALSWLFISTVSSLDIVNSNHIEINNLFAQKYSFVVILFALIGISLMYATISMAKVLRNRGKKES